MKPNFVYHFSEDPSIKIFQPHIPTTRTDAEPLVWAIDEEHAPLYWFPRDCPRITFWLEPATSSETKARFFGHTAATRVHAIESVWFDRLRQTKLYAYRLSSDTFEPYGEADGHWVSRQEVVPLAIEPVG
ncbi:hypothetical protein HY009_05885, partial [Candidatus Acetothermia bacterium]|nr:hypothetical protein [Candidatus Acetothermia bacterium]